MFRGKITVCLEIDSFAAQNIKFCGISVSFFVFFNALYLKMGEGRMHNRVVCSTCGNRMMLKYHICDVCYQATKHQTEKMLYEYREKTGNKFLVDEVQFEWKTQSNTKSIRQRKDGVEGDVMDSKSKTDVVKVGKNQTVVKLEGKQPKGWFNVSLW